MEQLFIEKDGWTITYLARSLFPGGPGAYRVDVPEGTFYFGMVMRPDPSSRHRAKIASISNFGHEDLASAKDFFAGDEIRRAKALAKICAMLVAEGGVFTGGDPIVSTALDPTGGMQFDIF